ncbi:MAG: ABC transporter permease [Solirubrobacteraceae bacterium]|nr:ABC transporter permease [Solirubrobacteraceae bacterium]
MRWLLLKDLQILRRSPMLVGLLVIYPILISLLIGFALSRGPDKPKIAFVNEVPDTQQVISVGGDRVDIAGYSSRLFERVDPVQVDSREEALKMVEDGDVLGALVIPEDAASKLQSAVALGGSANKPTVEVLYSASGPLQGQLVQSLIDSTLAEANVAIGERLTEVAAGYLNILLTGGSFSLLGQDFDILGLSEAEKILTAQAEQLPAGSQEREDLERVARFAKLAVDNLDFSDEILSSISNPIEVKQTPVGGSAGTSLESFAVAASVALSLMFVCVLLAAGMLALEREEHAYGRLVRGLVGRSKLIVEKIALAALCALPVGLIMLVVVALLADLDWARAPQWVLGILAGGLAFGALGVAIGAVAREVRAASLLAFLLSLPIAFLALVPAGTVNDTLYDVIRIVSAAFPFKPALLAMDAALNQNGDLWAPLAHLLALTAAYAVLARVALRRFG